MNIIVINSKRGHSRTLPVPRHWPWLLAAVFVLLPALIGVGAYQLVYHVGDQPEYTPLMTARFADQLNEQEKALSELDQLSQEQFRALTLKLAQAQARLVRLDALGERLVEVADVGSDEFDFSTVPGLGGPESADEGTSYELPSFMEAVDQMAETLERRERQLDILEDLLADKQIEDQTWLSGRPLSKGWMSSRFGRRSDPFTGRVAWHKGVDFAGKEGTPIVATGSGVVTFSGVKSGYGKMVEVNHGNGITTRYGHALELLVEPGEIVRTGDVIAKVGNSGRSTGPHVHYEVLKNGAQVNPQPYIYRARR
ncbi:MAG: peptidoglycan DD-metalloendopeptidase family protein [Alcanivorax sediminis]|uniref:Peptidoglycan DD-metalloendopeptidase family protein n=1 Tax=Alcanivorax sediminis TaxID=2663008 RepID=A0A6N7M474_9GAMM|nr:M23 family metallopeptidase [Alcanivorax sediminis]MQX54980.1 peptidoglycan DD-metalloendopeptidase family protein [Alcanivorax sediminis]